MMLSKPVVRVHRSGKAGVVPAYNVEGQFEREARLSKCSSWLPHGTSDQCPLNSYNPRVHPTSPTLGSSTMKAKTAVYTPIREESLVYAFINENKLPKELKTMVVSLLDVEEPIQLIQVIRGLPLEDQLRFVHRADQVCRDRWLFSPPPAPSLIIHHTGFPYCRRRKHQIRDLLGNHLQCHWLPTEFSCTLHGARETS